jgi:hypothetical protein
VRIVVDHLTRMRPGFICVAGINRSGALYVRPVLAGGAQLPVGLAGGTPFAIGAQVEIVPATPCGGVPEVEDHAFDPTRTTNRGTVAPDEFWNALTGMAQPDLSRIFGPDLHPQRNGFAVDEGRGNASLGALRPPSPPTLSINSYGGVRLALRYGGRTLDLSVADLRLYEADQRSGRPSAIRDLQRRIGEGVEVILSVGLARAFKVKNDTARRHWLQVNGIHLRDDPTWQG